MRRDLSKEERLAVVRVVTCPGGQGLTNLVQSRLTKLDVATRGMFGDKMLIANGQRQALAWMLDLLTESERVYKQEQERMMRRGGA